MKTVEIQCKQCGKTVSKPKKEIDRQTRNGRMRFFCGLSCSSVARNLLPHNRERSSKILKEFNRSGNLIHQHRAHLASQGWKYVELEKYLRQEGIEYQFEFPLRRGSSKRLYVYDLCLPSLNKLIEFDQKVKELEQGENDVKN